MDPQKDMIILENLIKIAAIQKLLVAKGIVSEDELINEMTTISQQFLKSAQETAAATEPLIKL